MDTSSGAAVHASAGSVLDLATTVLAGTEAGSGVRVSTKARVRLAEVHVHHNNHSGVVVEDGQVNVTDSSFHHNEPTEYGGGAMYTVGAIVVVKLLPFVKFVMLVMFIGIVAIIIADFYAHIFKFSF